MKPIVSPHRFYVYLYARNGLPFYVGKGSGERINAHFMCAHKHQTCKHRTCRIIRKAEREGEEITAVKIADGISEQSSFKLERLFISYGVVSGWPLVNQTVGGEGVSGYVRDDEWRKRRSQLGKQLAQEGKFDHLKMVNRGRQQSVAERKMRQERVTQAWSDPSLIEQQRHRQQDRWSDPEEIRKQKERFADSEMRVRCGAANKGRKAHNTKTYEGFVSPDGVVYAPIHNLTTFCREHHLHPSGMCLVDQGKQSSHKGWTRYNSRLVQPRLL